MLLCFLKIKNFFNEVAQKIKLFVQGCLSACSSLRKQPENKESGGLSSLKTKVKIRVWDFWCKIKSFFKKIKVFYTYYWDNPYDYDRRKLDTEARDKASLYGTPGHDVVKAIRQSRQQLTQCGYVPGSDGNTYDALQRWSRKQKSSIAKQVKSSLKRSESLPALPNIGEVLMASALICNGCCKRISKSEIYWRCVQCKNNYCFTCFEGLGGFCRCGKNVFKRITFRVCINCKKVIEDIDGHFVCSHCRGSICKTCCKTITRCPNKACDDKPQSFYKVKQNN
jgi:hypothetical protein